MKDWKTLDKIPPSNYDVWGYWKATDENYSDHQAKCHYDHNNNLWNPIKPHHKLTHWRKDFPGFEKP